VRLCEEARACPHRLGEARHLLANDSEARYWLGRALEAAERQVGDWAVHSRDATESLTSHLLLLTHAICTNVHALALVPPRPKPPQAEARQQWEAAAAFQGDFQGMAVCAFSEQSLHSALSLRALGREQVRVLTPAITACLDCSSQVPRGTAAQVSDATAAARAAGPLISCCCCRCSPAGGA
jgi:hypothetical protein